MTNFTFYASTTAITSMMTAISQVTLITVSHSTSSSVCSARERLWTSGTEFSMVRMSFLSPNQQRQSTQGYEVKVNLTPAASLLVLDTHNGIIILFPKSTALKMKCVWIFRELKFITFPTHFSKRI